MKKRSAAHSYRTPGIALLIATCLGIAAPARAQSPGCLSFPPVPYLVLEDIYTDSHFSIVNQQAEQENNARIAAVDQFMHSIEQALDAPSGSAQAATAPCAYQNFRRWASADALGGKQPTFNNEGIIKRGQYLIGLDLLAIKFKVAGFAIDKVILDWLHDLNDKNIDLWQHGTNRGNLYVWSGAAAALFAVLDRDPKALRYEDQVWHDAMAAIHDDGTITAELARAHRALIYHMYSFSATLILMQAREAMGEKLTQPDLAKIHRLATTIGQTLCDPHRFEVLTNASQEIPGDWGYRVPLGFGENELTPDWLRCGMPKAAVVDIGFGGDTRRSAAALHRLAD